MSAETLLRHTRHALRTLVRVPQFSLAAIGVWALAMAGATATASIADDYFFRPPAHVRDPGRVVRLYATIDRPGEDPITTSSFSYSHLAALQSALGGAFASYTVKELPVRVSGTAASLGVGFVSPNYFGLLGVRPEIGRVLEVTAPDAPSAVISDRIWRRSLGSDPGVVGRTLRMRDRMFTIIGVAPRGFTGGDAAAVDAWVSLGAAADLVRGTQWRTEDIWWLDVIARVPNGMDRRALEARTATALARELDAGIAPSDRPPVIHAVSLHPGSGPASSALGRAVVLVAAASLLLLLIASVNVSVLFLLRGFERQRELDIRRMLGASVGAVLLEILVEIAIVAVAAGLLGIAVATLIRGVIAHVLLPSSGVLPPPSVLRTAAIGAAGVAGALFLAGGIAGASALIGPLRRTLGNSGISQDAKRHRVRAIAIASQLAAVTILSAGALILAANLAALRSLDLGLDPRNVVVVSVSTRYLLQNGRAVSEFMTRMHTRSVRLPGVERASLAISAPFVTSVGVAVNAPDHQAVWELHTGVPSFNAVGPEYFATIGMRRLTGRLFSSSDTPASEPVVIVNETFARTAWPGGNPIGQCVVLGAEPHGRCSTVVGVVADARRFTLLPEEPNMQVYVPLSQNFLAAQSPPSVLLVRAEAPAKRVLAGLARIVREEAPPDAEISVRLLEDDIDPQVRPWRSAGSLWAAFAAMALLLTTIGACASLAYAARQRQREISVRLAVGASPGTVVRQISRAHVLTCLAGILTGSAVSLAGAQHVANLLSGPSAMAPALIAVASLTVAVVVLAASGLSARSAVRRPIMAALQSG